MTGFDRGGGVEIKSTGGGSWTRPTVRGWEMVPGVVKVTGWGSLEALGGREDRTREPMLALKKMTRSAPRQEVLV